ncbi:unnamed protein product [Miscanthus lutarioriparius]|uniref:CST complex subunit CTC1 n=1 Tax=Miscanthus lutarioriparius TaxID=422564 RepID=A0A811N8C9_9POAL|nr:unnamed protein product [Miscanthus lutarioriparius]
MEASAPGPPRFTVADLLQLRRPTAGASSLLCPSVPTSSSTSRPRKKHKLSAPAPTWSTGTVLFAPISHPVLLSGTLSSLRATSPASCRSNCFSFSDPSPTAASTPATAAASVCCCILDFDPTALGREILVLAWNYLPSVRLHAAPGVLEVVRWRLAEEEESAPPAKRGFLATVPFHFPDQEPDLATRGLAFGLVRSVSVVFSMPLAKTDAGAGSRNPVGFLAEILCCGCRRCYRATPPEDAPSHKFETMKFVYFVDASSMWRPVLVWLVGRLVYISGLKKKIVSVGDKASHTMLVSSAKTAIAWCPSYRGSLPLYSFPEKCGGEYAGVITGIYSQGLVVELDNTAWLLIDDQQLPPPHSLRVGAIVSVKNFRATCLNFAWTRIVLLATCCKTCITVNYFSSVDSKIHLKTENKGLLGTFVDSLEMPARFWMLLLISCFKQKFTKLFSDKEILGSQNKQGVVHAYATKILPSKCQPKESLIMKFCRHNCGSLCLGSKLEGCKLAIPFSNLVFKGESLWISSMLKLWNGSEEVGKSQGFLCDGFSYTSSTKRLISSEDLDFVLVGSIKTSPLSGRLQLVDSTGCIDIFIPDLPPNESLYGIYEIVDYKLALEGPVAYVDHYDVADPLSCKAVFQKLPYKKRLQHLNIYVIVQWRELIHIGPSLSIASYINYRARLFHLMKLSHIFPVNSNIQCQNMSGSLYAEAVILPYVLKFIGQGEFLEDAEGFIMSHSTLLGGKVSIDSQDSLWSFAVTIDGNINIKGPIGDQSIEVYIRGYSNKHSTVGIGPGATVTFHRVCLKQHRLLLTSETYIEVSSISHANFTEQSVISSPKSNWLKDGSLSTASLCLFFHQKYFTDSRPMQFHCRVATVLVLVLNKSTNHGETPNNVITSALNPDDINGFNVELPVPVQNMRMLWIEEVFPVDPLEEARRLCDILEHS